MKYQPLKALACGFCAYKLWHDRDPRAMEMLGWDPERVSDITALQLHEPDYSGAPCCPHVVRTGYPGGFRISALQRCETSPIDAIKVWNLVSFARELA